MNILVFSWRDPKHPLSGGAEQVMHEHMKGWVKSGHKVTLFSSSISGLAKKETLDGIEIIRDGYQYLGVQLKGFLYYLKNGSKFDFIVDQFHGVPFFTPLFVRKPKLAVIQEPATKVWFLNPLPRPLNWIIGLIGFLGEPFIFLFYRNIKFMTGSESAKKDVQKFGIPAKNITVVPHGVVLPDKLKIFEKEKIPTITFLGILSKDKGIEDAIRSFSIINNVGDYQFWVIGKPETEEYGRKIKRMVSDLGFEKKVTFWGFVTQEKKFELLSKSHIMVNPSIHEGWGLVNIEANSVGTPVIAYNVSGSVDSISNEENGIICQENNPGGLAKEVIELMENKRRLDNLSKSAITWSKNFSWERSKKLSLNLLNTLAGSH